MPLGDSSIRWPPGLRDHLTSRARRQSHRTLGKYLRGPHGIYSPFHPSHRSGMPNIPNLRTVALNSSRRRSWNGHGNGRLWPIPIRLARQIPISFVRSNLHPKTKSFRGWINVDVSLLGRTPTTGAKLAGRTQQNGSKELV